MSDAKDGGQAFPFSDGTLSGQQEGMSLRDYFAAHATDADVEAMKDIVPLCTKVVDLPG